MNQNLTPRINRLERNIVIDGGMRIWPEASAITVPNNSNPYGSVLLKARNNNTAISMAVEKSNVVPAGTGLVNSSKLSKTAAGTLAAGSLTGFEYTIEGYDLDSIYEKEFSIIFYVQSSVASTRSVALRNATESHSFVKQYSINAANTMELKVLTFPALNTCPGTLNRTNGVGLFCTFGAVVGSTLRTSTTNSWVAGAFASGVGEDTTWLTGTTHDMYITGLMILPGDWSGLQANPSLYSFIGAGASFREEYVLSKRFYEKSWALDVPVGAAQDSKFYTGITNSGGGGAVNEIKYETEKRATPSIRYWNGGVENAAFFRRSATDTTTSLDVTSLSNATGFCPINTTLIGAYVVFQLGFSWAADARF